MSYYLGPIVAFFGCRYYHVIAEVECNNVQTQQHNLNCDKRLANGIQAP